MSTGGESSVPVSSPSVDSTPVSESVGTGTEESASFEQTVYDSVAEVFDAQKLEAEDAAANAPLGDEPLGANEKPVEAPKPAPVAPAVQPVGADELALAQQWLGIDADTANALGQAKVSGMLRRLAESMKAQQPAPQPTDKPRGPDGKFTKIEIKNREDWAPDILEAFEAQQAEMERLMGELEPLKQVRQTFEQQQQAQALAEKQRIHGEFDNELVKLDKELFGDGKYSDVKIPEQKAARMEMAHKLETIENYYLQRQARTNLPVPSMSEMVNEAYRSLHADRHEQNVVKGVAEASQARRKMTTPAPSRKTGPVSNDTYPDLVRQVGEMTKRITQP